MRGIEWSHSSNGRNLTLFFPGRHFFHEARLASDSRYPCLGALLAFCVPYSSAGGGQDPAPPVRRKWVCPLSDDQQQKAPKAFAAMTPTFLHPRCVNCHDVVDTSTGDFHLGGVVDPTARETRTVHRKNPETGAGEKITEQVPLCSQCHIDSRSLFFFKGKDLIRLCRQMKGTMDNADRFMGPYL